MSFRVRSSRDMVIFVEEISKASKSKQLQPGAKPYKQLIGWAKVLKKPRRGSSGLKNYVELFRQLKGFMKQLGKPALVATVTNTAQRFYRDFEKPKATQSYAPAVYSPPSYSPTPMQPESTSAPSQWKKIALFGGIGAVVLGLVVFAATRPAE